MMLHFGILVKDGHQKTVEMLAAIGTNNSADEFRKAHLHIIDNGSKYPYRSYFFESLPWASITVHRPNPPLDSSSALQLLKSIASDGDSIVITRDCKVFESE